MTGPYVQVCTLRDKPPSSVCLLIPTVAFLSPYMRNSKWKWYVYFSISECEGNRRRHHLRQKCNTQKICFRRRKHGRNLHGPSHSAFKIKDSDGISLNPATKAHSGREGMDYFLQWICMLSVQTWPCGSGHPTPPLVGKKHLAALWDDPGK